MEISPGRNEARAGVVVMGLTYAGILVRGGEHDLTVEQISNSVPGPEGDDQVNATASVANAPLWLRVAVEPGARCNFSYSTDGNTFEPLGRPFVAEPGRWMGAKVGLICTGKDGYADFEWFKVE